MFRFLLYALAFYFLFRLIRRLFSNVNEQRNSGRSGPQQESGQSGYQSEINEAEIEDATFDEIDDGTK